MPPAAKEISGVGFEFALNLTFVMDVRVNVLSEVRPFFALFIHLPLFIFLGNQRYVCLLFHSLASEEQWIFSNLVF